MSNQQEINYDYMSQDAAEMIFDSQLTISTDMLSEAIQNAKSDETVEKLTKMVEELKRIHYAEKLSRN